MNKLKTFFILLVLFACSNQKEKDLEIDLIDHVTRQLEYAVEISEPVRDSILTSPRTIVDGELKLVRSRDWTSGFFPGN